MTNHDREDDLPIGISAPARGALAGAGIETLEHCASRTEAEVMKLHGMGPKAMRIIRSAMADKGLSFTGGKSAN